MNAGRDLDAEIARKIFRYVVMIDSATGEPSIRDNETKKFVAVPPFSTDTTVAHAIVQKYKDAGCTFNISNDIEDGEQVWSVSIRHTKAAGLNLGANGATLPEAICNAVLHFSKLFKIQ